MSLHMVMFLLRGPGPVFIELKTQTRLSQGTSP